MDGTTEKVREVIARVLNQAPAKIGGSLHLINDLSGDSLNLIEIALDVEHTFGIEITDDEAERSQTLSDWAELVGRKLEKAHG